MNLVVIKKVYLQVCSHALEGPKSGSRVTTQCDIVVDRKAIDGKYENNTVMRIPSFRLHYFGTCVTVYELNKNHVMCMFYTYHSSSQCHRLQLSVRCVNEDPKAN